VRKHLFVPIVASEMLIPAICALSPSSDSSYLAYPSPVPSPSSISQNPATPTPSSASSPQTQSGDVILFSTRTLTLANVIRAHKAPISFLALNPAGTLLATASDKGTVIRVWSVPGAEKLYQFRRGTREARIYSINFNAVSTLLAVSSAHDTVHIFKLGAQEKGGKGNGVGAGASTKGGSPSSPSGSLDSREGPSGMEGGYEAFIDGKKKNGSGLRVRSLHLTRNLTSSMGGYLPNTLTELWEPSRDFAFLKLPTSGARCVVALSGTMPQVMVISSEGFFYSYNIDLENGGECSLMKQYSLLDSGEEAGGGMAD